MADFIRLQFTNASQKRPLFQDVALNARHILAVSWCEVDSFARLRVTEPGRLGFPGGFLKKGWALTAVPKYESQAFFEKFERQGLITVTAHTGGYKRKLALPIDQILTVTGANDGENAVLTLGGELARALGQKRPLYVQESHFKLTSSLLTRKAPCSEEAAPTPSALSA